LLHAAQSLGLADLSHFLIGWRARLREELLTNASGYLTRKQPSLAKKVPVTFPHYATLFRYVNLDTSWTENTIPDASNWVPGKLNIAELASLCELYFTWGTPSGIMANFRGHIYAGACVQRLSSVIPCFFSVTTSVDFLRL
jgi:Holliday junction resolvase YEN1